MGETKTNFIQKNKQLGRVADINKRRFSGAFDHLNMFPSDNAEKERLIRIKTMKRAAVTARAGIRKRIGEFDEPRERSQTPAIHSYRNYSVNEKRGIKILHPNSLVTKINPHDMYEKIVKVDKPLTSHRVTRINESLHEGSTVNFEPYQQQTHRPGTVAHLQIQNTPRKCLYVSTFHNFNSGRLEGISEDQTSSNLGIHVESKDGVQYFTLFNKNLQRPTSEPKIVKHEKKTPKRKQPKIPTKKVRTFKRENIQLETVLGKLLTSYAILKPKVVDPSKLVLSLSAAYKVIVLPN